MSTLRTSCSRQREKSFPSDDRSLQDSINSSTPSHSRTEASHVDLQVDIEHGLPAQMFLVLYRYGEGRDEGGSIGELFLQVKRDTLPVHLELRLALRAALKTKYVGMVILREHPSLALENLLAGTTSQLNYTIRFPLPSPLPSLVELRVNGVTLCRASEEPALHPLYGGVLTNILLEHTFPAQTMSHRVGQEEGESDFSCGDANVDVHRKEGRGKSSWKWPWLVAIFLEDEGELKFHCSGNLITQNHIVTAAHCLRNPLSKDWNINNFRVYLGVHSLDNYKNNTVVKKVKNIRIHPDYDVDKLEADIAVITIETVTFNRRIHPVCMWNGGKKLKTLTGHLGTVVGWGPDRETKKLQSEPEVFHLPVVNQAACLRSRKEFLFLTSERTLCAGSRDGTGPCNGDSGSGLLILTYNQKNALAWHLRGLSSHSLLDRVKETCDLKEYIVFTDVARFNNWIKSITNKTISRKV